MRFILDENIRKEVTEFLRSNGHDILAVPSGAQDAEIARIAKETKRTIVTHDQHFADILMYPPEEYPGIIRIKIHPPTATTIINALRKFLQEVEPNQINKKLVILEKDGFRIR